MSEFVWVCLCCHMVGVGFKFLLPICFLYIVAWIKVLIKLSRCQKLSWQLESCANY